MFVKSMIQFNMHISILFYSFKVFLTKTSFLVLGIFRFKCRNGQTTERLCLHNFKRILLKLILLPAGIARGFARRTLFFGKSPAHHKAVLDTLVGARWYIAQRVGWMEEGLLERCYRQTHLYIVCLMVSLSMCKNNQRFYKFTPLN